MRLRFLPLALCLLLTIHGNLCLAFSVKEAPTNDLKRADSKAVSTVLNYEFSSQDEHIISGELAVGELPKNSLAYNNSTRWKNSLNSKNEVFSYKLNTFLPSDLENISQNTTTQEEFTSQSSMSLFKNGMYYGFAIMIILLNLVCFFLFDEKIFLRYSAMLTAITLTFFFSDGLLALFNLSVLNNLEAIQSTLLLLTVAFSAWFATRYLTLSEFFPKLNNIAIGLLTATIILVALAWSSENTFVLAIANTFSIAVLGLYFIAGVLLFARKNYAKFYVIASAIPLLFLIDFFVMSSFGIDFLATKLFHIKAATLIQMLILTYAIMYRMRAIKEENLLRQTELRIFLKRQEVMNRADVAKLMEDVYLENLIMQHDLDGLEIKLLQYISEGKENSKIARKLKMTELEVEELTRDLYHKLEISERIQEDHRMLDTQPDYIYN